MPRFFFDFHDGEYRPVDTAGIEMDDAEAAKHEARQALVHLMLNESGGDDLRAIACHVRNESGDAIYCAALTLTGGWVAKGAQMVG